MSKILIKELQDVLGVSKNNAAAFVEGLSQKYLIDLVPLEDIQEINETAGTIGTPLTEEEIKTLDEVIEGHDGQTPDEDDCQTDSAGEEVEDDNYEGN